MTATATATATVTSTPEAVVEEVDVVPDACLEAIDLAEQFADVVAAFSESAAKYPPLVADAYEAGLSGGNAAAAAAVIKKVQAVNRQFDKHNAKLQPLIEPINDAKAECRSAAE